MADASYRVGDDLIEAVPNLSIGPSRGFIDQVIHLVDNHAGVVLLNWQQGRSAGRTVLTLAGPPCSVMETLIDLYALADLEINLNTHRGSHPRVGAIDVCPLVPLIGVDLQRCVELSRLLADVVATQFKLPVFLYGAAARTPLRTHLSLIRHGGLRNLSKRMKLESLPPDFGPPIPHPRLGVTVIGARRPMLAFNITLNTKDTAIAKQIAYRVRESGPPALSPISLAVRQESGDVNNRHLSGVRAIGWYLTEAGKAQVSTNIYDPQATQLHQLYQAVVDEAKCFGVEVLGSECIGMVPKRILMETGLFACNRLGMTPLDDDLWLVQQAIAFLNLTLHTPFDPCERTLEEALFRRGLLEHAEAIF